MEKTAAERLRELAGLLSKKAQEIRDKIQGVEKDVNTIKNKTTSKQSQK